MTESQKNQIFEMRRMGYTYKHIATTLSLQEGTVKSYYLRTAKRGYISTIEPIPASLCKQCSKIIEQVPKRKKRLFCSKTCRQKWWNSHLFLVDRSSKALYHYTCPTCGKPFTSYGNAKRTYCSHGCYITSRYYTETSDGR